MVLFTAVGASALAGPASASTAQPVELIQNGGFESGALSPWTTTTTANQYCIGGQTGWRVGHAGTSNGNCRHAIQPADGSYEALTSFDGGGPYTLTLSQTVAIPAHATASLSWKNWIDVSISSFVLSRTFDVKLLDTSGATLTTLYHFATNGSTNTGWQSHSADVSAYAGQTVKVAFQVFVPQYYTGPAQLDLDSVSLQAVQSDTTPPVFDTLPAPVAEATGPDGAVVAYATPTATDDQDPSPTVACSPASDGTFAIGVTPVSCTATDATGNVSAASFDVTVQDTTAPALSLPASITVDSTGPEGAAVTFAASASDIVDGATSVACAPASGSTFAAGTTTVSCSSTDAHGNTATGAFSVTVRSASEMLASLGSASSGVGPGTSLADKVASAQSYLAAGDTADAISTLKAYLREVSAQSGKKLTAAQAATLTAQAKAVIAVLGG